MLSFWVLLFFGASVLILTGSLSGLVALLAVLALLAALAGLGLGWPS